MKKLTALLLSALTLLTAVSCSSKSSQSSTLSVQDEKQMIDNSRIYRKTELPFPEGMQTVTEFLYSEASDRVYIIGADSDGDIMCCMTDSSFSMYDIAPLDIPYNTLDFDETAAYAASADRLYAVISHADHGDDVMTDDTDYAEYMSSAQYTYTLNVYDKSCGLISSDKIEIPEELPADSLIRTVTGLQCAKDGGLILRMGEAYLLADADGRISREIEPESLSELIENSEAHISYYSDSSAFYGIRLDGTHEKLIDLANSGLVGISRITLIAGGDFVCSEGNKIYRLSERDAEEFAGIQEITLAVAHKTDRIQYRISEFNAQSNRYRITVKNYLDNYEYNLEGLENAVNDLEMDIIAGRIPDMVWLDTNEIEKLSSKGAFADLYEFIDSDRTYKREDFLQNYLEAAETGGHLYSIAPTFIIKTFAVKSKFVSEPNWTFDEFKAVYDSHSDDMELFESANNRDAILSFLTNSGSDFVDYGAHSCSFDSGDFIDMLEFSAQFPGVDEYDFEGGSCRDETALISWVYIQSFRDMNVQKKCIFGDDMTFVGFPSESRSGSVMLLDDQFAIMERSENKDGAWELIRSFLSDDNFMQNAHGIPVTESGLSIAMSEALERPYYIDDRTGKKVYMGETGFDSCTNEPIKNIQPMTEEEQKQYEQLVRSTVRAASSTSDDHVSGIVHEESARFFAGECTARECADMIQNRVSIMLSEQS